MTYPRRSFLRDTGLVSLAGAFGATSLLTGCFGPKYFESGVRVFFAGSWIFCGIPSDSENMMAVAMDPCVADPYSEDMDVSHKFPYGIWDEKEANGCGEDWNLGQLIQGMNLPVSTKDIPHIITVPDWKSPYDSVDTLFTEANTSSRFVYMQSKKSGPHWENSGLRVIKLPIPTRIIPAAFLEHATLCERRPTMQTCKNNRDKGVATSHIFEYRGAKCIHFCLGSDVLPGDCTQDKKCPVPVCATAGISSQSNLHFHTVPQPNPKMNAAGKDVSVVPVDHPRTMFHHLAKFLDDDACQEIGLEACMTDTMLPGHLVPSSVSIAELQIHNPSSHRDLLACAHKVNLASCDSGGLGVSFSP